MCVWPILAITDEGVITSTNKVTHAPNFLSHQRPALSTFTGTFAGITLALTTYTGSCTFYWWISSFYTLNHTSFKQCLIVQNKTTLNPTGNSYCGWICGHGAVANYYILPFGYVCL
ncbi:hypothetical protein ATANTOWER_016386 [Ataeniobius toweri]|uniref:Uncharacterized protein n=1 Tax=Ataeniobius toweri TaxID=208326 RepID=A0ABU7CBA1_9TELE|nr:hypothetical protein [Ataeniobius toweri]